MVQVGATRASRSAAPLLIAAVAATVRGEPALAETFLVDPASRAKCIDGSTPRYWYQPATAPAASSKWAVHMQGGGWCESLSSCADRGYSAQGCLLGSSDSACFGTRGQPFAPRMSLLDVPTCEGARWCGALMLNDPTGNPLAAGWNKLYIPYCDGGSFGGRNLTATLTSWSGKLANGTRLANVTVPLHFRGRINLEAVVDAALNRHGLDTATDVLVGGDSAGGLATYWSADWWATKVPKSARFGVAPDSGMFLNASVPNGSVWRENLGWVVSQMNATASLDASCLTARPDDPTGCMFPDVTLPHIAAPVFVMQGMADPTMGNIVGAGKNNASRLIARAEIKDRVGAAVHARPHNAAFLTMCEEHCGQWGTGQRVSTAHPLASDDFNVTIDGVTGHQAVAIWYADLVTKRTEGRIWTQQAGFPCATCCSGGNA